MRLIQLKTPSGNEFYVNPGHVVAVVPAFTLNEETFDHDPVPGECVVVLVGKAEKRVTGDPYDIAMRLTDGQVE